MNTIAYTCNGSPLLEDFMQRLLLLLALRRSLARRWF